MVLGYIIIYPCSWVYLKSVPVVSFDLRCQSGIWILSSYILRLEGSYSMYCSLAIVLTVITSERQKPKVKCDGNLLYPVCIHLIGCFP